LLADASSHLFTDASAPEPYIGQYDLQPILTEQPEIPLTLMLPTLDNESVVLKIPMALVQEWQAIANS
jgi:hypothetical protein